MSIQVLTKTPEKMPAFFDDFFKLRDDYFNSGGNLLSRILTMPAVNISENKDNYQLSLALPAMKKNDFKINVDGNILTISCEKEETKEEKEKKFTRREYNYSFFTRSFTLPEEALKDRIEARYEDGVLELTIPRKVAAMKPAAQQIAVK